MHAARIEPSKEWLLVPVGAVDEVERSIQKLLIDRLHSFLVERAGILAILLAPFAEAGVLSGVSTVVAVHLSTPRGPNLTLNSVPLG